MKVDLIYLANEQDSFQQTLEIGDGCCVQEAIEQSDLFAKYPNLSIELLSIGIFSQKADLNQLLSAGDRIEIYRELTITPMDKRRLLASRRK